MNPLHLDGRDAGTSALQTRVLRSVEARGSPLSPLHSSRPQSIEVRVGVGVEASKLVYFEHVLHLSAPLETFL